MPWSCGDVSLGASGGLFTSLLHCALGARITLAEAMDPAEPLTQLNRPNPGSWFLSDRRGAVDQDDSERVFAEIVHSGRACGPHPSSWTSGSSGNSGFGSLTRDIGVLHSA